VNAIDKCRWRRWMSIVRWVQIKMRKWV